MTEGQGFQFVGGAILPLDITPNIDAKQLQRADGHVVSTTGINEAASPAAAGSVLPTPTAPASATAPLKPTDLVKMARDRVREINAELKRMKALKKERDELQRLINAAKAKPKRLTVAADDSPATVSPIRSA